MIVSAFYDSRKKKVETIISDTRDGTPANKNGVKAYIDKYCPPEFRMIDGVDSLSINIINAKIEFINETVPIGYSDSDGSNAKMPQEKFVTKF
ncbi:hypothetical protein KNT92_gp202 [Klebsiella phage Mineola]|uniref:Uncharacterized protein n=1 Tax=Klebsiella phage Mineola TaxID=2234047 RepID=A0A2Z4QAP3_9CAUD|nr:hypothetical protein KNT92_gp202 [Klebsiella phage Mineola]AWY07104.1 hypothetical protein CPT_Mineola_209 [Klebsiella phage Mineola]